MKYEYMKEYPCNGKRPKIERGVEIELYCGEDEAWYASSVSHYTRWDEWDKFRVVDERFKPKNCTSLEQAKPLTLDELSEIEGAYDKGKRYLCVENDGEVYLVGREYYTNGRGIVHEHDDGGGTSACRTGYASFVLVESDTPKAHIANVSKEEESNWYDKGELPHVGSKWQHRNGNIYTVTGYANEKTTTDKYPVTVIYQGENGNIWCRPMSDWHRSMTDCTERDKLVEQGRKSLTGLYAIHTTDDVIGKLIDAGWRPMD